ncbi:hypothetical protein GCM10010357_34730 [Streptomyces luteireticuli]|uniref:Uncharacterized protein n=1 Tax=Streptomyces luteireticuli TaxID=173858 RepID=A0ABN0YUW1_9ACTN
MPLDPTRAVGAYLRAQAYRDQLRPVPDPLPPEPSSPPVPPEAATAPPAPAPAPAPANPFIRFLLRLRGGRPVTRRAGDAGPCAPPSA